jgi:uncharacterized protein YbjT (DUF2867 family)
MASFLILGGTGKVGRRLTESLVRHGHTPVPASRHSAVRFDWGDPATWPNAFADTEGLFVVGPGSAADWSLSLKHLLAVARSAKVGRAVLLSSRGVEFLPGGVVAQAEQALREGPLPWTILRPTHFAQNFTEAMFTPQNGVIRAPVGSGREPFIDVADVADVASAILSSGGYDGAALSLSGPEAISFPEAASILTVGTGKPVRFESESDDAHIARLRADGTPEGYIRWRMAMLGGIRRGSDAYLSDGVQRVLGRRPATLRQWAQRELEPAGPGGCLTQSW